MVRVKAGTGWEGRGSGPQNSVRRLPGSGQVQCTSWRNFAPFSSSTFKTIHGEQAGKRDRGGSAVSRHDPTTHDATPLPPNARRDTTNDRLVRHESFSLVGSVQGLFSCFSLSLRFPPASHVEGSSLTTSLRYQDAVLAASYIYS